MMWRLKAPERTSSGNNQNSDVFQQFFWQRVDYNSATSRTLSATQKFKSSWRITAGEDPVDEGSSVH